jgi:tetratricopeptide (TPR) repeat protein
LEPDSKRKIGFDKLWASRFEIVRPPAKYLMELEVGGFERVRGEIEIASETKVIDVKIDKRSALPLGIQRIFSAAPLAFGVNERETLIERGKDAARRGQYVAAVNLYDKALAMDAKDKQTLNYKGYALFRLGKLDDAYKVLTASRQIDADYFLARLNLAKVACRLGRTKEATDALAGGNALTPRQARVVLQDGEYLLVCKTAPEVIKNLASKN